jgi:hypothetical protein
MAAPLFRIPFSGDDSMKSLRLSALAAALVLGACSAPSPTDPASLAPSFDEGPGMMGSGNGVGTMGSGGGTGSGDGTTTSDIGSPTTSNDTTQRGGGMLGSGN